MKLWKRSQIQVFFIKRNVFCLSLLVTIPKRDRVHGWQSLQPDYWLVPSCLLLFVSGHGTVVGDYYGIWCEGDDGKMKGGKRRDSLLPTFPSSLALLLTALLSLIGTLRSDNGDGDGNENVKKATGLVSKTTTLHVCRTFLYISLPSLHDYEVEMPIFTFYGGPKQAAKKFTFSFWTWI